MKTQKTVTPYWHERELYAAHWHPTSQGPIRTDPEPAFGTVAQYHQCFHNSYDTLLQDILLKIYLSNYPVSETFICSAANRLCVTLPRASRTALDMKFSEAIRLIQCFWRFIPVEHGNHGPAWKCRKFVCTFRSISHTVGSTSSSFVVMETIAREFPWPILYPYTFLVSLYNKILEIWLVGRKKDMTTVFWSHCIQNMHWGTSKLVIPKSWLGRTFG